MGFFGHLVAARTDASAGWPRAEPVEGDWAAGIHVWRVPERIGGDWGPVTAFVEGLTPQALGGFLSASVFDSDGAFVHIGVPGKDVARCWLHLDGVVAQFFHPWAPFDEAGDRLSPEAEAAQDATWESHAAAYRAELERSALSAQGAADACRAWALASGLEPGSVEAVATVLESHGTFVEETWERLLGVLGAGLSEHGVRKG